MLHSSPKHRAGVMQLLSQPHAHPGCSVAVSDRPTPHVYCVDAEPIVSLPTATTPPVKLLKLEDGPSKLFTSGGLFVKAAYVLPSLAYTCSSTGLPLELELRKNLGCQPTNVAVVLIVLAIQRDIEPGHLIEEACVGAVFEARVSDWVKVHCSVRLSYRSYTVHGRGTPHHTTTGVHHTQPPHSLSHHTHLVHSNYVVD